MRSSGTLYVGCVLVAFMVVAPPVLGSDGGSELSVCPFYRPVFVGAIKAYQRLLGPVRVVPCSMLPSCSEYARQAFEGTNPLRAALLTSDRLQRCGKDPEYYDVRWVDGFPRYVDPLYDASDLPSLAAQTSPGAVGDTETLPAELKSSYQGTATTPLNAGPSGEAERLFRFAEQLEQEADFGRAITEYRRFLAYFPRSDRILDSSIALVRCHYAAGEATVAAERGRRLLVDLPRAPLSIELQWITGLSHLRIRQYGAARSYFARVRDLARDPEMRDKSLYLTAVSFAHERRWQSVEETLSWLDASSALAQTAGRARRAAYDARTRPRKHPLFAGLLSIVPGLGYIYSGHWRSGLSSLAVNGLFAWATVESFRSDRPGTGITLSTLGLSWYAGNIYGAALTAQRFNTHIEKEAATIIDSGIAY